MKDKDLIKLFYDREEVAISNTRLEYGGYIYKISYNILENKEDAQENQNEVLNRLWDNIPPAKPDNFRAYLARLTRNSALDKYRKINAQKRLINKYSLVIDELTDVIADETNLEEEIDFKILVSQINAFLKTISDKDRQAFIMRYFYLDPIKDISQYMGITENNIKVSLYRSRERLRDYLIKEGYTL